MKMLSLICRTLRIRIPTAKKRVSIAKEFSAVASDHVVESSDSPSINKTQENENSVFDPLSEDISHVSTYLRPTFNMAAYSNKSETIRELVRIGVDLHTIEKKDQKAMLYLLQLSLSHLKDHLVFLSDIGMTIDQFGRFLTKNSLFLKEDLNDLRFRVDYLRLHNFNSDDILRIISTNPFWLTYSTEAISEKLTFFKRNFILTNKEVRQLVVSKPTLITHDLSKIELSLFYLRDSWGFLIDDLRKILLKKPSVFLTGTSRLESTVEFLLGDAKLNPDIVIQHPEILTCRKKRLRERHEFLLYLNKAQYDPKKPNYVSPVALISQSDAVFATDVAHSSSRIFNSFIKNFDLYIDRK